MKQSHEKNQKKLSKEEEQDELFYYLNNSSLHFNLELRNTINTGCTLCVCVCVCVEKGVPTGVSLTWLVCPCCTGTREFPTDWDPLQPGGLRFTSLGPIPYRLFLFSHHLKWLAAAWYWEKEINVHLINIEKTSSYIN